MSEKKKRNPATAQPEGGEPAVNSAGGPMNVRLLEQIVKLMAANDLNTVDVRDGDKRVILKRGPAAPAFAYAPAQPQLAAPQPLASAGSAGGASAPSSATDESAGLVPIKAEMVGTFYSAPKPGEKPFVNVGSEVDEDTEVCLIEAMKNYFAVKAGTRGAIARVLVQDGQTVQFDQPLFLVRPK